MKQPCVLPHFAANSLAHLRYGSFFSFVRQHLAAVARLILNYRGQRLTADPDSTNSAMLALNDDGTGQTIGEPEFSDTPYQLVESRLTTTPSPNSANDTLYLSIIRNWKDPRDYRIKIYPKKWFVSGHP